MPADPLLRANGKRYSHGEVLSAAESVVDDHGIGPDSAVAVRGSFASPAVVVAGLVAPIVAGARLSVGPESDGDLVVGGRDDDVGSLGFQ